MTFPGRGAGGPTGTVRPFGPGTLGTLGALGTPADLDRLTDPGAAPTFLLLGPPTYVDDGRPVVLAGRRQASLFTMLAYHAGTVVHPRALLDELWGPTLPVNPTNALQSQVSRLRRVLGESAVVLRDAGYALEVDPLLVDTVRFEALVARGHHLLAASEPSAAEECFVRGLQLWRGEPLARLTQLSFVARECRRLEDLRVHAVVGRARAHLALGHGQDAVSELHRLVDLHPTREDLWAHLALTLYRCGRQAEALATLRSARIVLADELGLDPGPALRALEAAILRQDIPSH